MRMGAEEIEDRDREMTRKDTEKREYKEINEDENGRRRDR